MALARAYRRGMSNAANTGPMEFHREMLREILTNFGLPADQVERIAREAVWKAPPNIMLDPNPPTATEAP